MKINDIVICINKNSHLIVFRLRSYFNEKFKIISILDDIDLLFDNL